MKKLMIIAAVLCTTAAASYAQEKAAPTAQPAVSSAAPEFKFEVEEYNFGTVKQGEKVTYAFKFINAGKEPLIITTASGSCGCTVPEYSKEPIKKGEKGEIKVVFDSAGKVGMQDRTVTISSNAKDGTKVLHLKGNVEEVPGATPAHDHKH